MSSSAEEIERALRPLREAPEATAILTDLDGTLAEIVDRPGDARIDPAGSEALGRIAGRYRQAGVLTGRQCLVARQIVGLDGLIYVGNHGAERLPAGERVPRPAPALDGQVRIAAQFAARLDAERLERAGISLEDKGSIQALHWRSAPDHPAAEEVVAEIGGEAEEAGLWLHRGRMVLEVRPPVEISKGAGLRELVSGDAGIRNVFYGGDDHTDADAFEAMAALMDEGELERAISVGVISPEAPARVADAATLTVDGVRGYVSLLERLG